MMIYIMAEYRPAGPVYLKFVLIVIIHYFYIIFQMTVIIVAVSYRDIGRSGSADLVLWTLPSQDRSLLLLRGRCRMLRPVGHDGSRNHSLHNDAQRNDAVRRCHKQ